ncbi:sensor histidine kinase [Paenibacillus taiwanensis]|uniref:sensor histidine kinase n=1 Tax=Paenibacillus taiwanensis TaxID=401638 RepID=UPI001FDFA0F2|nr:sensor histidine kinase [Paenibacillus taiwanensis]
MNNRANQIIVKQANEQNMHKLESVMNNLELTVQHVDVLFNLIATNTKVLDIMAIKEAEMSPLTIVKYSELLRELGNITAVSQVVSQITMYHAETNTMISTVFGGRHVEEAAEQTWIAKLVAQASSQTSVMIPERTNGNLVSAGQSLTPDTLSFSRLLDRAESGQTPSLMMMTLHKHKLAAIFKPLLTSQHTNVVLRNREGHVIAAVPDTVQGSNTKTELERLKVSVDSPQYAWTLEVMQPYEDIYEETKPMRQYTYLIIISSLLLALFISWGIYNRIAAPLWQLTDAMKSLIGGHYDIQLKTKRKDEFGYLMHAYNRMAAHQKHLIQDHYEQQLRIVKTELSFLQSQINPHFLYNTLNSIYWTAKNYEAEEISEMVLNLSHFFRLSLHKGKDTFTVAETIEHLDYYIRIQQARLLDSFQVKYKVQEACKSISVLKLLLQPLVENAVIHGLEKKQGGGLLIVSGSIQNGFLMLSVQDNGSGIQGDRLHMIEQALHEIAAEVSPLSYLKASDIGLYGLRNVCSRMKMYYGKEARLICTSAWGEGTTVTMMLPVHEGE